MNFSPDLRTRLDQAPVKTEADWLFRRKELLDILAREEYGITPPAPGHVTGIVKSTESDCCSGHAVLEQIDIQFDTPTGEFSFPMQFFSPTDGKRHPLIILLNFRADAYDRYFSAEEIIDNGFALAVIHYTAVTADSADFSDGLARHYARRGDGTDWGKIGMWAFAMSRALDYLKTRDTVDENNVAAAGHSRLGKAALWCAAQDERFRFALSNDSGCGGAALEKTKHEGGETIAHMAAMFPFWFCENRNRYANNAPAMPFDQHFLLALIAPRFLAVGSASLDQWADPYSEQLACVAATPAWEIFGKKGYTGKTDPAAVGETFSDGSVSYHMRDGIHFLGRADWLCYLRFMKDNLS